MSIETGIRCDAWRPNQVMIASQAQASTMIAAPTMVPTIRPGLRLRMVWLVNICSWVRHSSSPTPRPLATRVRGLAFETTQHRADVLLATAGQVEEDLLQRLPVLSDHVSELLQAAHGDQPTVVDDRQPAAHPLGDLQDVGGEEHRLPLPAEVLEDVFRLPGARAGRSEQADKHLDGGRLAGAVGPEEAEELAASHLQVQVLHGGQAAVALGQEPGGEHRAQSSRGGRKKPPRMASGRRPP